MKGLLVTIDVDSPKWKLSESLIGTNPGLGFRPMSHNVDQGSLIWYDASNQTQIGYWVTLLDDFLEGLCNDLGSLLNFIEFLLKEYKGGSHNQKICDFTTPPNAGQACKLDMSTFGKCGTSDSYGYNNSAPCIFLKLNRIYGWQPEYFNDPAGLPEDMPESLKDHIKSLPAAHRDQIWVTCYGENGADREILGDIEYFPTQGFPSYFYPYENTKGYLSPLVAVKFTRPKRKFSFSPVL
jgi:sodium/potassium-transporting ATPase subunit beta